MMMETANGIESNRGVNNKLEEENRNITLEMH